MLQLVLLLSLFFFSVMIHECAHGWVANWLGDPTAKLAGRLTLNPLAHIDPIGTVLLPMSLVALGAPFVFGWAKPVPVNALLLHQPRRDMILVALAGPGTNLGFAAAMAGLLNTGLVPTAPWVHTLIACNLILGVFNLIPIPPLDGSRVLLGAVPGTLRRWLVRLEPYGTIILLVGIAFGILQRLTVPLVMWLAQLLGVSVR